jgi:hypothetical protein
VSGARFIEAVVLVAALCGCATNPRTAVTGVVAARLEGALPADQNQRSLWLSEHIDCMEGSFGSQTTRGWRGNYDVFSRALIDKANRSGFDSESLTKVLRCILAGAAGLPLAYVPVAAYETTLNGEPVWVVAVHWEEYFGPEHSIPAVPLGHIRSYAFTQKDLKQVGFITCR